MVCCFQVEELRKMVERIQGDTEQVKKVQSAILSAPVTDESKWTFHKIVLPDTPLFLTWNVKQKTWLFNYFWK